VSKVEHRIVTHRFLRDHRDEIIAAWEVAAAAEQRGVKLTGSALRAHLPQLLEELATWLDGDRRPGAPRVRGVAARHAAERLAGLHQLPQLFDEFRLLRTTILRLLLRAQEGAQATGDEGRERRVVELARLNAGLDHAITAAVEELVGQADAARRERESEQRLRIGEAEFRTFAESMPQIVWVTRPDGWTTYFNQRWVDYTGLTLEESYGQGWNTPFHPEDQRQARDAWQAATRRRAAYDLECRLRRADGAYRWWLIRAVPLVGAAGEVLKWVGTCTDIHELRETKDAVERANAALARADRKKSDFLAVLSHELRNPLAPIRNSIYLLERATPDSEQASRARQVIRRQAEQLTRLVDDLLDVTRISRGKIKLRRNRVDLREIVRNSADDLRTVFEQSKVDLRVDLAGPVLVDVDEARIAQVIANLLSNAVKFTPANGTVKVGVHLAAGHAVIVVRDSGAGIQPDQIESMFEPFTQADHSLARTQGGLGLGLALVKALVELHGGSVGARSEGLERGAEFTVTLPLAAEVPTSPKKLGAKVAACGRLVLVIEDNIDAGQSLADLLELQGHRVHLARDGRSGIELARKLRPDVVLCDIGLPDLSGYDVARALRSDDSLRAVRLIAHSGYAQPEDRRRAREAGFEAHVVKPASVQQLQDVLAGSSAATSG
jgi:PAS domain S-box-containing protein